MALRWFDHRNALTEPSLYFVDPLFRTLTSAKLLIDCVAGTGRSPNLIYILTYEVVKTLAWYVKMEEANQTGDTIPVSKKLLGMLLDASIGTALTHRGKPDELYALGAKEATANIISLLCYQADVTDNDELASKCMWVATDALSRRAEISPEKEAEGIKHQA